MDYKETLLTKLEVSSGGELVAGFRSLGDLTFPNWLNTFCTFSGTKWDSRSWDNIKEIIRELHLKSSPEIATAVRNPRKSRTLSKGFVVYQIDLPVSSKEELPKAFVRGNYTKLARFKLKNPWHYVPLPLKLFGGLEAKQDIENRLYHIRDKLTSTFGPVSGNRNFNKILLALTNHDLGEPRNLEDILGPTQLNSISPELFSDIGDVQKQTILTNDILGTQGKLKPVTKQNKKTGNWLNLEAHDWNFLTGGRMISIEELFRDRMLFLDIEIPLFRSENPAISWVGSGVISPESTKYTIDTIHDLNTRTLADFNILSHGSEEELVEALSQRIRAIDPAVISAHNSKFDLTKLRESRAGFSVGEDESPPLYKVTTPFFERLGIRDRLVLDTMRWYKIAHAYDLNAKLELMTGEDKSISYDEMESLERGTIHDKLKIANYLTEDIRRPIEKVLISENFKNNLRDVLKIAEIFNISPERLLHSPNCVNEAQERAYFSELGIYREEVPPNHHTTRMQKKRERSRDAFVRMVVEEGIHKTNPQGIFDNVVKAYIPIGNILRDLVSRRFPEAREFYSYRDSQKHDSKRLFFIEQYSHALAKWLVEGYGEYLIQAKRLKGLRGDIQRSELDTLQYSLLSDSMGKYPRLREALNLGRLSRGGLEKLMNSQTRDFITGNGFDHSGFLELINSLSKLKRIERRFVGNFNVFPTRGVARTFRPGSSDCLIVNDIVRNAFCEINNYFDKHGLQVIAQEGNYLYIHGNIGVINSSDCPVIPVDSISRLFHSDHPYYKKGRFYSHLRVDDDPSFNLSLFEMRNFQQMLEALLGGDYGFAKEIYTDSTRALERGDIAPEELIYQNKSRGQYFIYSTFAPGKTYFVKSDGDVPGDASIYERSGRRFFFDSDHNQNVRIMGLDEAAGQINREAYFDKFVRRGRAMLGKNRSNRSKERFNPLQGTFNF